MTWGEYDGVSDPGEREPGQQRASVQSVGRSLESVAAGTTDGGFGAGVERELVGRGLHSSTSQLNLSRI
jgi:hypothetical protein